MPEWRPENSDYLESTFGKLLNTMRESPLRNLGAETLVIRCLIVPTRGGAVSVAIRGSEPDGVGAVVTGRRADGTGYRAKGLVDETVRPVDAQEWRTFRARYSEMARGLSGKVERDESYYEGTSWVLEADVNGSYNVFFELTGIKRPIRNMCEFIYELSALSGNLMNGDEVVIRKAR